MKKILIYLLILLPGLVWAQSGIVPDKALSTNVPFKNKPNTWSGLQSYLVTPKVNGFDVLTTNSNINPAKITWSSSYAPWTQAEKADVALNTWYISAGGGPAVRLQGPIINLPLPAGSGGSGDVSAAGDNNFLGNNYFTNRPVVGGSEVMLTNDPINPSNIGWNANFTPLSAAEKEALVYNSRLIAGLPIGPTDITKLQLQTALDLVPGTTVPTITQFNSATALLGSKFDASNISTFAQTFLDDQNADMVLASLGIGTSAKKNTALSIADTTINTILTGKQSAELFRKLLTAISLKGKIAINYAKMEGDPAAGPDGLGIGVKDSYITDLIETTRPTATTIANNAPGYPNADQVYDAVAERVPKTTTIAGLTLNNNRTATELRNNLYTSGPGIQVNNSTGVISFTGTVGGGGSSAPEKDPEITFKQRLGGKMFTQAYSTDLLQATYTQFTPGTVYFSLNYVPNVDTLDWAGTFPGTNTAFGVDPAQPKRCEVGVYQLNVGTGALTQVAVSDTLVSNFSSSVENYKKIPMKASVTLQPGFYFVAYLYNSSTTPATSPRIRQASSTSAQVNQVDTQNTSYSKYYTLTATNQDRLLTSYNISALTPTGLRIYSSLGGNN